MSLLSALLNIKESMTTGLIYVHCNIDIPTLNVMYLYIINAQLHIKSTLTEETMAARPYQILMNARSMGIYSNSCFTISIKWNSKLKSQYIGWTLTVVFTVATTCII